MNRNKIIMALSFVLGLMIFLYPVISNISNSAAQNQAIHKYNKELKKLNDEQRKREIEEARRYNESLIETEIIVGDPYADEKDKDKEENKEPEYISAINIGNIMGNVEIPKIGVDIPIYHGTSELVLQKGVGHIEKSSLPIGGVGTHSVLTAHRGLPSARLFRDLDKLKIGDKFYIHNIEGTIAYQVDDINIVLPYETEKIEIDKNKDYTTLLTCEPYMINTHRLLVRGSRIDYIPSLDKAEVPIVKDKTNLLYKYRDPLILLSIIVAAGIVFLKKKSSLRQKEKI